MTLPSPLSTLLYFAFLPCMLGLCVSLARDAMRRDRRAWLTGQAWLDSFDDTTQEEQA